MPTAEVRVPAEFLLRARHIWRRADTLADLTGGSLSIWRPAISPGPHLTRSNRMTPPKNRWRGSVMRSLFGAAGAGGQCAPAALVRRARPALQL